MKNFYRFTFVLMCLIIAHLSAISQGTPARQESKLDQVYVQYNLTGQGTIIAIIDRGIDYFHPDFIDENGKTRLLYLYDMINPAGANDPDNPYGVGTIYTEEEINASLETDSPPLSTDRHGHGTATSGIASGNGSGTNDLVFQGVASKAKIIVVKAIQDYFPPFDDQPGQDGLYNPTYIPIALQFIADKVGGMPSVTLLNMGSIGGPTDGTSTISRAMDDFVNQGHTLVCGVGDDGGADNHAFSTVNQDETVELMIQKGENGNLRLDIWYSEDDRIEVTITKPDNTIEGPFNPPATANDADDRFLTGINYYHRGANVEFAGATSNRRELMIDFTGATGEYKVELKGININSSGEFHATLNPSNYHNSNLFLNHIVEGFAINDFASAEKVITPTDYVVKNDWIDMDGIQRQMTGQGNPGELWAGSSFGPTHDGRMGVDFAATGEVLYAAYSHGTWYSHFPHLLLQGGENLYGIQNAVSAAAPLTTGVIALMLEMNPELTPEKIKEILQGSSKSDSFTGTVPNNQWGYGKLDALAALMEVETLDVVEFRKQEQSLVVFPNPVNDRLNLYFNNQAITTVEHITIINNLGQLVKDIQPNTTSTENIEIRNLTEGIYHIIVQTNSGTLATKFIKN